MTRMLLSLALCLTAPLAIAQTKLPAESIASVRSASSDFPARILFVNHSGEPVKLYWIDTAGRRKLYDTLKNGESDDQPTYLTHPWLVTDANDNAWYLYYADAQPRTVEITAPARHSHS